MRELIKESFIYKIIDKIFSIFDKQVENSCIVNAFLKEPAGEEVSRSSIFYKLWLHFHNFICSIYEKLHLEKIFGGSIFTRTYFWCAITCVMTALLPTSIIIVMVSVSVFSILLAFARDREMQLIFSPVNKYVFIYIVVYIFAIITSLSFKESVLGGMVFVLFTFFGVAIQWIIDSRKKLEDVIKFMVAIGAVISIYGIAQYVSGMTGNMEWIDTSMFDGITMRVYATMLNPNVLAEYLILITPVAAACFMKEDNIKLKIMYAIAVLLLGICMILTFSRGGWLGLLLAGVVFIVLMDKRFILLGIVCLVALYFILPDTIINRFTSIGNLEDSSTAYRVYIWIGTLSMLKDYWLCGTGFGEASFEKVYPAYALHAVSAPHSHNLFLQITAEAGIMALIMFVIALFVFFRTTGRALKNTQDKKMRYILIGFISSICGFLVQSMTDYTFYNYRVMLCFWIIISLGMIAARVCEKDSGGAQN